MTMVPADLMTPLTELLLSVADDKFMLGHRNADWTGLGPMLEEDIAFSSLAQDDLAHATALYEMVAELSGDQASRLAYGRRPEEYRCAQLVELDDGFDWAWALARQFLCDHLEELRLARLAASSYEPLRALAVRLLAEERLSLGHADQWIVRLGRGGAESAGRVQAALDRLAEAGAWLHEPTTGLDKLEQAGVYPRGGKDTFESWANAVRQVVDAAGLRVRIDKPDFTTPGGRRGRRSADFAALHRELTEVYVVEPEAVW